MGKRQRKRGIKKRKRLRKQGLKKLNQEVMMRIWLVVDGSKLKGV
jgi:hypothetical protein